MKHQPTLRIRHTLFALITALSLLIAPLAPLGVAPMPSGQTTVPAAAGWSVWLGQKVVEMANYFMVNTVAAQTAAPGGVSTNLRLWVKAEAGTNTTTPGANVTTWNDQSGNSANMAVTAAGREPIYQAASAASNYNPSLLFADPNDGMELAPFMTGVEAGGSVFGAASNNSPGTGFDNLVVFGIDNPHLGTATGTGAPLGYMNGSSPIRADHPATVVASQFHIWNWEWNMSPNPYSVLSNTGMDVIFNGETFSELTMEVTELFFAEGAPSANEFQIGSYEAVEVWDGNISEVIVYDRNLTAVESQRVSSYMSIKYGTTLDTNPASATVNYDYLASDGTTVIWAGTSNAAYQPYHNNVAGIGRDDDSALDQRKSNSVNAGFQPIIDNGAAFSANNSYLVWGSDAGLAKFGTTYTPTSYTPATGYFRMTRIWKVQETGTVGAVQVQGPTNANLLLVDNDGNYANGGTTEVVLTSGVGSVDFTNGQYFTFGAEQAAPGGVANGLQAWYDAATGVTLSGSNVSGWADRTFNDHDTSQATASRQPLFEDGALGINFNPSIHFQPIGTATEDMLSITGAAATNNRVFQDADDGSVFAVGDNRDNASPHSTLIGWGTDANNPQLATYGSKMQIWNNGSSPVWTVASSNAAAAQTVVDNQPYLYGWQWLNAAGGVNRGMDTRLNGNGVHYPDMEGSSIQNFVDNEQHIGWNDCCSEDWTGRISEIAVYNQKLDGAELQRVDSYFALKYGITLNPGADDDPTVEDGDYVDSGGAVVWDYSANTSYHNDIASIGRDDASGLNQKQSKSANSGFQPIFALGTIAADNAANSNTFSANKSFLVWGSDTGAASFGTAYAPTSYTPTTGYYRMDRVWKVQETGTVGSVQVQGPANANLLLVDNDGDYTNGGVTEVALTAGAGNVDFTSGQYFTFGAEATAPGGVANGLRFWVRADKEVYSDAGSTPATAGSSVQQWSDQSFNGFDVAQTTASQKPTYQAGTSQSNFNPYTEWQDDFMTHIPASGRITQATDPLTMLATGWKSATSGIDTILELENNSPTLDVTNLDFNPWADGSSPAFATHIGGPVIQNRMHLFDMRAPYDTDNALMAGLNGYDHANNMELNPDTPRGADVDLGSDGGGEDWDGGITEAVVYNRELSGNELAQVRSYLAIRNGLTLDADPASGTTNYDYLNSAAATIWSGTSNAAYQPYHNNVAGIGRDDASALDQRKSNSINGGFQPVIEHSAAFSVNNSYLVWGNDTGAASFGTAYAPTSYTPTTGYFRMTRIWKVQETGTLGTVAVQGPVNANLLLVDDDGNYTNGGTTEVALVAGLGTVDFTDGQFFTFGAEATAPGGIAADLALWLKANAGTSSTTNGAALNLWQDQSLANNDAAQGTASVQPEYVTNSGFFNFNPSANFNPNARMQADMSATTPWGTNDGTVYVIYRQEVDGAWRNLVDFGLTAADSNNPQLGMTPSDVIGSWHDQGGGQNDSSFAVVSGETHMAGYDWTYNVDGQIAFHFDGQVEPGGNLDKFGPDNGNFANIGGDPQLGEYMNGQIAEVVIYQGRHDAATRQKVHSYLALKYGITLRTVNSDATIIEGDYIATDGTKVWDYAANSTYHNDVAGIGRDDAQALYQKQSKSINGDDGLTMSIGPIAATNAANTGVFANNLSYVVWGNNNQSASTTTTIDTSTCPAPGISDAHINRIWKVQETGAADTVAVQIDSLPFNSDYPIFMLVSDSNSFATYDSIPVTYNGSSFDTSYDFPTNGVKYITFTGNTSAPADICTDGDKTINWWDEGWDYGVNSKVVVQGSQTFTFTIDAAANDILYGKPGNLGWTQGDWRPHRIWTSVWFPRWTHKNNISQPITFRMQMSSPAMGVSMEVCDVDAWWNRDVLTVNGKLGGTNVAPKLSKSTSWWTTNFGVTFPSSTQAQGGPFWWDCLNPGRVLINFDRPVDEVIIDYTLANPYNLTWLYNDLRIKGIDVQCAAPPPPPTPDNLYINKRATGGSIFIDDAFTFKFEVENLSCNDKTINFTDNLPAGLTWVGDSLTTSLAVTNTNNYSATTSFSTDIVVPPGKSFLSLDAVGSAAATYNNQASFTVGGNSYLSDDPNQVGGQDPTPITVSTTPFPYADITLTKSASQPSVGQNEVFTYDITFINNESVPVKVNFSDAIWPESTYVTNTLTNPNGGTVLGDYSVDGTLDIMGMTLPVGNSTLSIQVNSNNTPITSTLYNEAKITPDDSPMQFMPREIGSNRTGVTVGVQNITLPVKLFLQGAYDPLGDAMRDDLRTLPDFPLTSPYGDGATTTAPVLSASGADAIVDWVLVEVRDATVSSTVVISQSALLQKDGDVVDVDGTSTLNITGVTAGNYHVALHHRNHLGAMTGSPVALSSSTPLVNFTTMNSAATHGSNGQVEVETGIYGLWAGNVNDNNSILRSGAGNDLDPLVNVVLDALGNVNDNTNYVVSGYNDADVNMDGRVIAAGGGNDINLVLLNVISHPDNGSGSANYTVTEQMP